MSTPEQPAGGNPGLPRKPIEKLKVEKAENKEIEKEIEKIKPEKEHKLEIKEKPEKEKLEKEHKEKFEKEHKEKFEKEGKLEKIEIKEHKLEKIEIKEHKLEIKENKAEGKVEFPEKLIFEHPGKLVAEGDPQTGGIDPATAAGGLDPATLLAHADSLVSAGQQLRHFIETSMRPDLSAGALSNEADLQGEGGQ